MQVFAAQLGVSSFQHSVHGHAEVLPGFIARAARSIGSNLQSHVFQRRKEVQREVLRNRVGIHAMESKFY